MSEDKKEARSVAWTTIEYFGKKYVVVPRWYFYVASILLIFDAVANIPAAIAWWQGVLS